MLNTELWKYCSVQEEQAALLSLELLGDCDWPEEKQLACLYTVANAADKHYYSAAIAKKNGGFRQLHMPDPLLKRIQRNILEHILEAMPISTQAQAYYRGASIKKNALLHMGQKQLLKLDIRDFFGQINFAMVYRWAFPNSYFPPAVRGILTHLCCYRNHLPQGAPTSPAISNLVLKTFDEQLGCWCDDLGIVYSRYCDDLTFSGDFDVDEVKNHVRHALWAWGLALNETKTHVASQSEQQKVTGVVVNQRPQVDKSYRKKLRQTIYYCRRYGIAEHLRFIGDVLYLPLGSEGCTRFARHLLGQVHFVLQINPDDRQFREAAKWLQEIIAIK